MIELEVVPSCCHYGLGIIPWSPLAGGLLGGALKKQKEGRRSGADFEKRVEAKRPQLEAYEALCAKLGEDPAHVGLAWLLHNPAVTAPIIGPRTMEQMTGSLRAIEMKLDADTLAALDKIFPGPGEAPKAYSW
jgi:aryl-alcohol dehydrogenase-like predicted oxidoreductase